MKIPKFQNKALSELRDRISCLEIPVESKEISQISMSETPQIYFLIYFTRKN